MIASVFTYLCCLAFICSAAWVLPTLYIWIQDRRLKVETMRRDIKVKDEQIRQLRLEIQMLRTAINMTDLVTRSQAKRRGIYLVPGTYSGPQTPGRINLWTPITFWT